MNTHSVSMRLVIRMIMATLILLPTETLHATPKDKVVLGVSTSLTGTASSYGTDIKNVLLYANEVLAKGKYEFIFEDDKCSPRDAVTIAQRFINVLKLRYATGFACSGTVLPTASLYEKAKVLVMIVSASAADITQAGDYIFRTWPSDDSSAKKLFSFVSTQHQSLGVMSEHTDYAQGFVRTMEKRAHESSFSLINENYLSDSTDFRSSLLRLRAKGVEGLFINSQSEVSFIAILKQTRELNWQVPVYGAFWPSSPAIRAQPAALINGITFVDLPRAEDALTVTGLNLFAQFKQRYGEMKSVDLMFGTAFEGFRALHHAIESGEDERQYLYRTKFDGVFGPWHFDAQGDIEGLSPVIKRLRGNAIEVVP